MMHLRFLSAILFAVISTAAVAQISTTPNLVTNIRGTSGTDVWLGTGGNSQLNGVHPLDLWGCCTSYSGSSPFFDTSTTNGNGDSGQIIWSWGNVAVNYIIGINTALANAGTGIQINGYNWRYDVRNMNGGSGQSGVDTLTATSRLWNSTYTSVLLQQSRTHNTTMDWTTFSSTVTAATPYPLASVGNLALEFRASDSGFWAGYYGPQIRNVQASFNYTVDPCATNPRYSPSCAGYNDTNMWNTGDLTAIYGTSFAINQALGFGNSGVRVHSATWGYDYSIGGRWCSGWSLFGICLAWSDSYVGGSMNVTNSQGQQIAYDTNSTSGQNISGSFRREILLGNTSPDISTLGNANINVWAGGIASVTPHLEFNFTPDICNSNPLASPQCPGYAAAYLTQQCSANPLYDQSCPGYQQAYFTQQCSANALYNTACPGYAAAYLTYQCNVSQLYSPSCPGYQQAYLDQQCSITPLYSTSCSGYQTASAQCSANPLSANYCPGYTTAVNACSTNGLLYTYCPTYQTELNYCSTDPLFNNLCPTYQTATTQCAANPLTAAYCPNYQTATTQCSSNPLTAAYCPGYQTATASCSANTLNHSYCPGYQTALNTCSSNPLSNSLCSGYTAASTACSANQLTYTYCPSYTTAIAACSTNPQGNTMCPGYSSVASGGSGSTPTASTSEPAVQLASDGKVSTEVALVADSSVNAVITERATSSAPSPTATVNLAPQPAAAVEPIKAVVVEEKKEEKKEDAKTADSSSSEEKKEDAKSADSSSSSTATASSSDSKKEQPKTMRQQIQEQRVAAARAKAVEAGKELAGKMGEAASLEAQVAVQNVVIQAMGFTPGFDAYNRAVLPDAQGYRPFEIYPGQRVIDNPQGRRFMTGSDRLHQDMVDQQYTRSE